MNFNELKLDSRLLHGIVDRGYKEMTHVQELTLAKTLSGMDVSVQSQTGTGKTAAFALPLLSHINLKTKNPQILVLTPTRELAIQVAEAFQRYAGRMRGFHVLPILKHQQDLLHLSDH